MPRVRDKESRISNIKFGSETRKSKQRDTIWIWDFQVLKKESPQGQYPIEGNRAT